VLTREDLRDLRDIRLVLEGIATERAAEKVNQNDLSHIRELCNHKADSIKNDDTDAYLKQNGNFMEPFIELQVQIT
jgi:Transcriptional regulators